MAKTPVTYSSRNFYTSFRRQHPEVKMGSNEYLNILNAACLNIRTCFLEDGQVKLGNRLGDLMIRKFLPKGKGSSYTILDKNASNEKGKAVYQFNDHTGGFIFRFIWNKKRCKMINDKNMWTFKPIRSLKRKLAYMIKNDKADFPIGLGHLEPVGFIEQGSTF